MTFIKKILFSNKKLFLILTISIFIIAITVLGFLTFKSKESEFIFADIEGNNFEIILETNPQDNKKTDVYIKNTETEEITFLMTLNFIRKQVNNSIQFVNGKLYVKKLIGDTHDKHWYNTIWAYTNPNNHEKVHSYKGLSFLVNPYNDYVAVQEQNSNIVILDQDYQVIQKFSQEDLTTDFDTTSINLNQWNKTDLWLSNSATAYFIGLTKIDILDNSITKYPYKVYSDIARETAINTEINKIAHSNSPVFFGVGDFEDYVKSKGSVTLYLYDFITQEKTIIDKSITKPFRPKWIDNNTLEYNDPEKNGERIRIEF